MPDSGTEKVREMIEWAREHGVLLHSVRVGDCEVTLYDPKASASALDAVRPMDDDVDRDDGHPTRSRFDVIAMAKELRRQGK